MEWGRRESGRECVGKQGQVVVKGSGSVEGRRKQGCKS